MRKILVIARREYRAMIMSKGFLIGLALVPIMFGGGAIIPHLFNKKLDLDDKRIAVFDGTGRLYESLEAVARKRNSDEIYDAATQAQTAARFVLERGEGPIDDSLRLTLSDKIRRRELYAFVEIPGNLLEGDGSAPAVYHSESSALSDARRWLEQTLSQRVRDQRFAASGIDLSIVQQASRPVTVAPRGLFERMASGETRSADQSNVMQAILVPIGFMLVMFMLIMMSIQPMLECVLEERQQRIAEVLLGSVSTTQLMAGKLLGSVAGSLTTITIYALAGCTAAWFNNVLDKVPWHIVPWFLLFQVLAVVMYSAIVMALGASANNLQEAQGLMMIVWFPLIIPMFLWLNIVREPTGSLATGLTFFAPATPLVIVLRMASSSAVPPWQIVVAVALTLFTTSLCVLAAGRILRIAMLSQGNTPKLRELVRWAWSG